MIPYLKIFAFSTVPVIAATAYLPTSFHSVDFSVLARVDFLLVFLIFLWFAYPQPLLDLTDRNCFPWIMAQAKFGNYSSPSSQSSDYTANQIFPLKGVKIVVTGATSGIGRSLVLTLLDMGATVFALGRSPSKLSGLEKEHLRREGLLSKMDEKKIAPKQDVPENIKDDYMGELSSSKTSLITIQVNLDDLKSVSEAADKIIQTLEGDESQKSCGKSPTIDILVNNAGMYQLYWYNNPLDLSAPITEQGYDQVFGVNYLSHFLLTEKLLPALRNAGGTVVQTSSSYHMASNGRDLRLQKKIRNSKSSHPCDSSPMASIPGGSTFVWRDQRSYSNSKLAQILHARALARRENDVRFVSVCPAWVGTNIGGKPGSFYHRFINTGFPVEGWGLASLLTAMFEPAPKQLSRNDQSNGVKNDNDSGELYDDYFNNACFIQTMFNPLPSMFWDLDVLFSFGIIDSASFFLARLAIFVQRFVPKVIKSKSSPVSYDVALQEDLRRWSIQAVEEWL